ncbi:hypothetical protein BOX15_Mlig010689g3, partial [Macrostomum lignano]
VQRCTMPGGIPDRWEAYNPFKEIISDTHFLAVKVPLKQCYVASMPAHEQFTPSELMNRCKQMKLPLGLVVDLTFTTRYYNPQEFTSQGVKYEKIFVEGHNIPDQKCISRFEAVVNQFRQESPDSVVAVHCTHGVNRTGYMICRYLIDVDGWPAEKAIAAFAEARGFPIERENYLADLRAVAASQQQSKARATIDPPAAVAAEAGGAAVQSANSHDGSWQNQKQSRPKPYDHPASRRKAITGFHGYNGYQPYGVQYNFGYYDSYGNYFGPNYQGQSHHGSHGNQTHHGSHGNQSRHGSHGNQSHHSSHGNQSRHGSHGNQSHHGSHGNHRHHSSHGNRSHHSSHGNRSHHSSHGNQSHKWRHTGNQHGQQGN